MPDTTIPRPPTGMPSTAAKLHVLLTGATGKVGCLMLPRLAAAGHHVRALVRASNAEAAAAALAKAGVKHSDVGAHERVTTMPGDLLTMTPADYDNALRGIDAVVHLAAKFRRVPDAEAFAANLDATVKLAEACKARGVKRFVFASTGLTYGGSTDGAPMSESAPTQGVDAYPRSKIAAEKALAELVATGGMSVAVLRLPFVYGDGDPHFHEVFPYMVAIPPHVRMSTAHHADVAKAVLLALVRGGESAFDVFNVADDAPLTLGEMRALHGLPRSTAENDRAVAEGKLWTGSPFAVVVDTLKIRIALGFQPDMPTVYAAWASGKM